MSRKPPAEDALYVRLPTATASKLHRAAEALGIHKKDLVASLVTRYVDPDSPRGLQSLGALTQPRRGAVDVDGSSPTLGSYSFQSFEPEVMSPEQAASLLQLDEATILELAEAGEIPGRKLAGVWRFSRAALVAWLSQAVER